MTTESTDPFNDFTMVIELVMTKYIYKKIGVEFENFLCYDWHWKLGELLNGLQDHGRLFLVVKHDLY